jgi:predicted SAM-dependent methyltransferase
MSPEQPKGNRFRTRRLSKLNWLARVGFSQLIRNRSALINSKTIRSREYLDIGCGPNLNPGFINLDFQWRKGINIVWDVTRGLPLEDSSLDGVFSEGFIEHIPLADGDQVLAECYRVLKPGGTLRVCTPDAEVYLTGYTAVLAGGATPLPRAEADRYRDLYTPVMSVNRVFTQFGHRFIYDYATMRELLDRHGFTDITKSAFGEGRDPKLIRDTERRQPGALYVEATKPTESKTPPAVRTDA